MNILNDLKGHELISRALSTLKTNLQAIRSSPNEATEIIFHQVLRLMVQMLAGPPVEPVFHLAFLIREAGRLAARGGSA
jgi:hypothetical protein